LYSGTNWNKKWYLQKANVISYLQKKSCQNWDQISLLEIPRVLCKDFGTLAFEYPNCEESSIKIFESIEDRVMYLQALQFVKIGN